ncbi:MAG: hypothetical protein JOY79_08130, partial [Acidobacteriaceae bacterium]|nr:hypothetical protein [Acidobacteriaceae bacterium]
MGAPLSVNATVVATVVALLCGWEVVRADMRRRKVSRFRRISPLIVLDMLALACGAMWAAFYAVQTFALASAGRTFAISAEVTVAAAIIEAWLWTEGRRGSQLQRPNGIVFGEFLVLFGLVTAIELMLSGSSAPFVALFARSGRTPVWGITIISFP